MDLIKLLGPDDKIVAVVVPENRKSSAKVHDLIERTDLPTGFQPRGGGIPSDLPHADAAISWLYSQILSEQDIKRYKLGIINMHGGKLPEYRGASVLQWAIANGETELGITWHQIVGEVDSGPVWAEDAIPIPSDANALAMRAAMIEKGLALFPLAWSRFASGASPVRRVDPGTGKVWPQRRPKDGKIGERWAEKKVRDLIRALPAPWPRPTLVIGGRDYDVAGIATMSSADTVPYTTREDTVLFLKVERPEL